MVAHSLESLTILSVILFLILFRKELYLLIDVPNQNPFSDIYISGDIQFKPMQNIGNMRKMAVLRYRYIE